jgi:NAD(P)-dependent dehydrogenase (short-subunit alcohol dehydrogenase family)
VRGVDCTRLDLFMIRSRTEFRWWSVVPQESAGLVLSTKRAEMEKQGGGVIVIGKVAASLASDEASFITGQPVIVDGGFMAR